MGGQRRTLTPPHWPGLLPQGIRSAHKHQGKSHACIHGNTLVSGERHSSHWKGRSQGRTVAEVQLLVGVLEDGGVARQRLPLVEAHTCTHTWFVRVPLADRIDEMVPSCVPFMYWCIHSVCPTTGTMRRHSHGPTVKVGVMTAALNKRAAADATRRLCAVAQVRGQPAGGAVSADLQVAVPVWLDSASDVLPTAHVPPSPSLAD